MAKMFKLVILDFIWENSLMFGQAFDSCGEIIWKIKVELSLKIWFIKYEKKDSILKKREISFLFIIDNFNQSIYLITKNKTKSIKGCKHKGECANIAWQITNF